MKKKAGGLLLTAIVLIFTVCGCAAEKPDVPPDDKLHIVTTIFAPYDFVRQIAGDRVLLTMLLTPGSEAHSFEPSAKDIIDIQNCDLFVCPGGENDSWATDLLSSMDVNVNTFRLMDCTALLAEEDHDEWDEHVWTSPKNVIAIVQQLTDTLADLDGKNTDFYHANAEEYIRKLTALDNEIRAAVDNAPRRTLVFADRFAAGFDFAERGVTGAIDKVGPRCFAREQRREERIHPPQCEADVLFERRLPPRGGVGLIEFHRLDREPQHRRQHEGQAHAESRPVLPGMSHVNSLTMSPRRFPCRAQTYSLCLGLSATLWAEPDRRATFRASVRCAYRWCASASHRD